MEARGRGLMLASPQSCPPCGSPAQGHGSPGPRWWPMPWSALQREEAVKRGPKGKPFQLPARMWGDFSPPKELLQHPSCPGYSGTWQVQRTLVPPWTSIPQQIPSLPAPVMAAP